MRVLLLSLLAALIVAQAPQPAPAQPSVPLSYIEQKPDQLVEAAFSTPYGRLLVAEFAAVLAESADTACLKEKGIKLPDLPQRARSIVVRQGAQFMGIFAGMVDRAAFKAAFAARASADAEAELARLRNNPSLRPFIELAAAAQSAAIANGVIEMLDRNILVLKFKLARRFHALATGNQKLLDADPTDDIHDKLDKLVSDGKSTLLARYLELTDAAQDALNQSTNTMVLLGLRNVDLMPGLDKDLADACLLRQQ